MQSNRPTKYKQYDEDKTIAEIRRYRREDYSDREIRQFLDNMPERTFYDFVKRMYERDQQYYEEARKQDKAALRDELTIYKERLLKKLRQLDVLAKNSEDDKVKVDAIKDYCEVSKQLAQLAIEKPVVLGESEDREDQQNAIGQTASANKGSDSQTGQAQSQAKF
jgi:hypothetical protein